MNDLFLGVGLVLLLVAVTWGLGVINPQRRIGWKPCHLCKRHWAYDSHTGQIMHMVPLAWTLDDTRESEPCPECVRRELMAVENMMGRNN